MTESLRVELNRDGLHAIDAPPSFSVAGAFDVLLANTGQAVHVHLHLDDDLSRVARLDAGNHYVEGDESQRVHVSTSPKSEPVSGKLKIVTGYGAETSYIDVTIEPTPETKAGVDVDETLSKPPKREPEPSLTEELTETIDGVLPSRGALPIVGLLLLVLAVAGVILSAVQSTAVVLSVGVVLGAATVGAVFLLRK
ncbi:hypothetical protein GL213_10495 [Halogeometricum borinquense]|uniref:Uncharacterized protein n=1 Tax=Halogeometricum borinquense TaxID=60847 RepID=A0A6C0UE95_9EURY|nr:hypothetical protein [Halogeometricum borinquense]QIB73734.1 hypothetical protein G3I44_05180 [Halogeometricum borinquense]QIQ76908.1 hypothetical protein GL213_10495 [Halogeometricum borinquense]